MPPVEPLDPEVRARAIAAGAKAVRKPLPRGVWLAALLLGGACTFAAVMLFLANPAKPAAPAPPESHDRFALGVGLGLAGGIVIGLAIGRGRRASPPQPS